MKLFIIVFYCGCIFDIQCSNLEYLDPTKLQTKTSAKIQEQAAQRIIAKYSRAVMVTVNPLLFNDNKDVFALRTNNNMLHIRASTGVAAVWGFNYFLKKYCMSHIGWQVKRIQIPQNLPNIDEVVVANDRFRYYQNVCTASYSFLWWSRSDWIEHVEWMALNGINLALAPVAQEAAWGKIFREIGMTDDEIDDHFTGPAFLSWLRMGNVRGWGGPLPNSWHNLQKDIQETVIDTMLQLGIIPIFPTFNGHVPRAFARIFPNNTYYSVSNWNNFSDDYCCGLFLDPSDSLFNKIGKMFLKEIILGSSSNHIYAADPFNEIKIQPWSTALVQETAKSIYAIISEIDNEAVWLLQNWMFVSDPLLWPKDRVKTFLTSVPNGRLLVLDLQSEQWPQYDLYEMYFGQPFIWCMLHNFGGTLGMFGNMDSINNDVYSTRSQANSTMIGIGLTPEGINQNYVVYELMLESAWRSGPVYDLDIWVADYAERRYGCNATNDAWRYLLRSVYSFNGLNKIRGKYVVTRRPSFKIRPWAWYESRDLFEAFRRFVFVSDNSCNNNQFMHDLVDVTRQALQYRADQLYLNLQTDRFSNSWVFNVSINRFLDVMTDMEKILASHVDFKISQWLDKAMALTSSPQERYIYSMNARNQITLWGPNGEITDYACKQWAEMFHYYYIPRWRTFLDAAMMAKLRGEIFDEKSVQKVVRFLIEEPFLTVNIENIRPVSDTKSIAMTLYKKWSFTTGLQELPQSIIKLDPHKMTTLANINSDEDVDLKEHQVRMLQSTTSTI